MKTIKKNVYTSSNQFHQFSFSSYDDDQSWGEYKGLPFKSEDMTYSEDRVFTLVTKSILTDTPMCKNSLEFLGKGLLEEWSYIQKELEPIREYLKSFEITLSYNNYGSTMPVYEFTVKRKYENDVRFILDALIKLDIFDILNEKIYRISQTDLDYLYEAFEESDAEERLLILESYYSACEEVGYDPLTDDELVESLSYSVGEDTVRELLSLKN